MDGVRLEEAWFAARGDGPVLETTVGGLLRARAAASPDAEALAEALTPGDRAQAGGAQAGVAPTLGPGADAAGGLGRRWTYGALLEDAERLARALLTRFAPGERIAVWAPNIPEWVILEYAAGLAGLVLVTANPAYRPRELKYVLEQSGAVGLFLVREHRGNPMAAIAAEVAAELPALREVTDMEDAAAFWAHAAGAGAAGARSGARAGDLPEVRPSDPVQIQYTSGATGFPKGAVLHHRGITNNARFSFRRMGVREGETVLNVMPLFHTAGCGLLTLGAVQAGCRMILARAFEPSSALDIIARQKVGVVLGVPTMLVAMLEAQRARPRDLSSVRVSGSGGAMVPTALAREVMAAFASAFHIVYGQTETSCLLSMTAGSDDDLDTVGQPLPHTELAIRDPASGAVAAVGQVGEVCARGYGLMLGYNADPEATASTVDLGGWLHTGDLGTLDGRGRLRITGRVKEMIIRGGENLFPAEIEAVLAEHPAVLEAAVVGAPDPRWGEVVVAFVRLAPGETLDPAALAAHCRERISPQKTPAHWVEVAEWPLTGSGKVQKFVLRERWVSGAK